MPKSVLIIGAGPGGLASALLLAKAGLDVTILEKQPKVGGRTSSIESNGYRFDLGPTFFLYPQILQEIFAAVGRDLFTECPMKKLDPQYRLTFGSGGELNAVPNVDRMIAEIAKLSPQDAQNFRRFMDDNRVKLQKFTPCLQSPFLSWTSLLQLRLLAVLPYLKPWKSLHAELAGYFKDPRLQLAFTFQSKYLGMSPFQCPSLFSILSFLEYEHGVFHPIGGCNAVLTAMAKVATDLGVKIRTSEAVEEILFKDRRAIGVRTQSESLHADVVLINADFAHAMKTLIPKKLHKKWSDKKLAKTKFSCSTFMLYLGIDGQFPNLAHHNIYIAKNYQQNLEEIESRHILSKDPSFYVQNASITDPTLAPANHSTLYILVPTSHMHPNIDWSKEALPFRNEVLKHLENIGIHDLGSRIRFEKMITPADWQKSGIHLGATFNLAHNLGQMLHLRPHNRFEQFQNLYLTGGGTHPGSGLPVIFESARITTRLILGDE
jgi:phytoene desaturase